ncbi:hypothetical protein Lfu02_01120 [Longispora fulva]|uniref:Uncharacterized protein n=1 Tax=Longispora fulva TaxID=619741 RepID=A0A8J7GNI4_9ACTN|nr:hypothetical protein [Longispora fulva]MBG6136019.1 hypothetical protein [Longispora fulva]GIG55740.1 hypothetical protein Lfu02_01120 [Longispora fulva]
MIGAGVQDVFDTTAAWFDVLPGQGRLVLAAIGHVAGEQHLADASAGGVWFTLERDPLWAMREAIGLCGTPGVLGSALAHRREDHTLEAHTVALALAVSADLTRRRRDLAVTDQAAVCCPARPSTVLNGCTVIPHLITVDTGTQLRDRVMWEVIADATAQQVHGEPLPPATARGRLDTHLRELLDLRARARAGYLPDNPLGAMVAEICADGPLTITAVYREAARLLPLLDVTFGGPR